MNLVTVATFNERKKAEPLKHRLEKTGIHAEIRDESKYQWFWFVTKPAAGIRLKVYKKDFETARRLVREWETAEGVLRDAVRCPECGSSRVEYPQFTRKFFLPNLVGVASLLRIIDKEFFCQECEYTWPKEMKQPRPKKHGSPNYFIEGVRQPDPTLPLRTQK
jgi:ribosomal protein L37AE/L43A